MSKRVLSGIRATGRLHLGNYLGAVKGMVELQDDPEYETFYMIADLHAMTTPFDPEQLKKDVREVVLDYLAAGLDPEKSSIFIQSQIPEHTELAYLLSTTVTVARMSHLPTFKEKVKQYPENATMALLNYPVLMAADILLYKADEVPVGDDQMPHLEVSREIARKMNDQYSMDFSEPKQFKTEGHYIPSLTGEGKMSKSVQGSFINLTDDLETIKERVAKIPTDSGKGESIPIDGGVRTLFSLIELFEGPEKREKYERMYKNEGVRYSELKNELAESIYKELEPIQQRRKQFESDTEKVDSILKKGRENAHKVAQNTIKEVKEKMGLI